MGPNLKLSHSRPSGNGPHEPVSDESTPTQIDRRPSLQSLADLTDLDIPLTNLDSTLFPGLSSSIKVHSGFAAEHAK